MCILLLLNAFGILYKYQLSHSRLQCHLGLCFLFDFLSGISIDKCRVLKPPLLLCYCLFLLLWLLLVSELCTEVLLWWAHTYLQLIFLDHSLDQYVMSFFVSCNTFTLKFTLSNMCIATPIFFWLPFAWDYFFHPLTFSLKWVSCK